MATNAARLRLIAGPEKRLLEMGLRRAQGPDGGLTASTYSYLGGEGLVRGKARSGKEEPHPGPKSPNPTPSSPGFDSSSNVLAGQLRGVPVAGTLAHSFVTSFSGSEVPPDPVSPSSQSCCLQATGLKPALALGRGVPPRQVTPVLSQEAGTGCITFALKLGCPWLLPGLILHSWPPFFTNPIPQMLAPAAGEGPGVDLAAKAQVWLEHVCAHLGLGVQEPHPGERAAFVAYALAFPRAFQGLLDSYSVRR